MARRYVYYTMLSWSVAIRTLVLPACPTGARSCQLKLDVKGSFLVARSTSPPALLLSF